MGAELTLLTFEEWIQHVFDHPEDQPYWYWDWRADSWAGPSALTVAYLTRAFENAAEVLRPFSDAQVQNGLYYLFSQEHIHAFEDASVLQGAPWPDRKRGLRSMYTLFAECFAHRCTPHLSHLSEPGASPLNQVCYMWWDIYPAHGLAYHRPTVPESVEEDQVLLEVMSQILFLNSDACRESALHGLNHWQMYYPDRVETVIDGFLAQHPALRPELRQYALGARQGAMQ